MRTLLTLPSTSRNRTLTLKLADNLQGEDRSEMRFFVLVIGNLTTNLKSITLDVPSVRMLMHSLSRHIKMLDDDGFVRTDDADAAEEIAA